LVLGAASLCSAGTITYNYTGNDFTYAVAPYTTGDSIAGSFTIASPLAPDLVNQPITPSSYSFSDGLLSYTSTGSYLAFDISTAASGTITGWLILVCEEDVTDCGHQPGIHFLVTEDVVPTVFDGVQVQGEGYEATVNSDPGTWTATLNGFQGGTSSAPVLLISGTPVAEVTGTIGGIGSQEYYSFLWGGGAFSATASITGANTGASYLFSEGVAGTCSSGGPQTLNGGDSFSSTIAIANLPAGQYCIGIDANNSNDPPFALTFNTPVEGVPTPEPSTFVLFAVGLGMVVSALRLARRSRKNS
jgi:hypothetical protein